AASSRFKLMDSHGSTVLSGPLQTPGNPANHAPTKTFGIQLWEADFSSVTVEGVYRLSVDVGTAEGVSTLQSEAFQIRRHLVSTLILKPLTILNADARRAADEDMRRNWIKVSGASAWSVGIDGAFVADRADAGTGALLERVFNGNNSPLNPINF